MFTPTAGFGVNPLVPGGDPAAYAVRFRALWSELSAELHDQLTALDALPIEWDYGPNASASSAAFAAVLKAGLDAKDAVAGNTVGDAAAAIAAAPRRIEAVYSYPHQNHATMETMNATARE